MGVCKTPAFFVFFFVQYTVHVHFVQCTVHVHVVLWDISDDLCIVLFMINNKIICF